VYVPVPPDGTASRLTRVPVVPVVGAVIDADSGGGDVSVFAPAFGIRGMIPAERISRIEAMTEARRWLVRNVLTIPTTPFLWLDAYTRYANINCNYY